MGILAHHRPNVNSARKHACTYVHAKGYIYNNNSVFSISCFRDVTESTAVILFTELCILLVRSFEAFLRCSALKTHTLSKWLHSRDLQFHTMTSHRVQMVHSNGLYTGQKKECLDDELKMIKALVLVI